MPSYHYRQDLSGGMTLDIARKTVELRRRIRQDPPLVHFITNLVTMNLVADATLALGALPIMALALPEVADVASSAQALVLNTGTPSPERLEAMLRAGTRAGELGIPILLDPVGAGATPYRLRFNRELLEKLPIAVIKGNRGEVAALLGEKGSLKGVEAVGDEADPARLALAASRAFRTTVAVTGERDFVSDGNVVVRIDNGHPLMRRISGAGCMAGAVMGAFLAAGEEPLTAAVAGLALFGLAGEKAASLASGPGSFKVALLDTLANLTEEEIHRGLLVEVLRP